MQELLTTKLFIPPTRPELVTRPRLIEQLNEGPRTGRKLTLISAPAGFGKTTLASEWVHTMGENTPSMAVAWLSLDEGDNDSTRFLTYIIAALRSIDKNIAKGALSALQSPQPPPTETILVSLINEIAATPRKLILVLDDYHVIEALPVHDALSFLLKNLPPQMHVVIATREDPLLPLASHRARGQLTELRAADLRFQSAEAAEFLNRIMGFDLSEEDIYALEARTEGWIAGLQLAAISMQKYEDITHFIHSFTGSHRLVLDYLIEEVLDQQPDNIQTFLLRTSILDRLCGPLCDAVMGRFAGEQMIAGEIPPLPLNARTTTPLYHDPTASGQDILEYLERTNLFIVPLDAERNWYRYHHLFADLLRQRLDRSTASKTVDGEQSVAELHLRASVWYEKNGLELEAFKHAVAANDVEHAARLIEGGGMPLTFRGALAPVMNWLDTLPDTVLNDNPLLWITYASAILGSGQRSGVEQKLQAAEAALEGVEPDDKTRDLLGRIAATRATLAWGQNQVDVIIDQSNRALQYLHSDNLPFRTSTIWKLGAAYQLRGDRAAAMQAYSEAVSICEASGNIFINILASTGLGSVQESENQLYLAAETYQRILRLAGDDPPLAACGAYLGLAHINYEWNDLEKADSYGQRSLQMARHIESTDAFASCGVFLARLKLAQGDVAGADAILTKADRFIRQHNFMRRLPAVVATQVLTLLHQGNVAAAADLAETYELPISQARVHLAQGDTAAALAVLKPYLQQVEAEARQDERLRVMVLLAVILHVHGQADKAVQLLSDALELAEPGGFIRIFVDEGPPMAPLLYEALSQAIAPDYVRKLLAAFANGEPEPIEPSQTPASNFELIEPLSERELEVLHLIADGLTNQEIATRLYLSLNTVKVHTRNIYGKLTVNNRTQAVARARKLGILPAT